MCFLNRYRKTIGGFTLAELLIALGIMGVIATFTIPKVLSAQAGETSSAKVKEAASIITGAYQMYQMENQLTGNEQFASFTKYLNYVAYYQNNELNIDSPTHWGVGARSCDNSDGTRCLKLHNGAVLLFFTHHFNGKGPLSAIYFLVDPDGVAKGTPESSSIELFLHFNGRITDISGIENNTCNDNDCHNNNPGGVPAWFHW